MRQNGTSATSMSNANASRRGVALVMFVMLVFAFLAMAALSIDIGLASLTQAQMQNAVDSAAIEAVATRDLYVTRSSSNLLRRRYVVPMRVRDVFDDDFVPHLLAPEPDAAGYGAGPVFRINDGVGDANALALIEDPTPAEYTVPEAYVDSPRLQSNQNDLPHGDMVSGTYVPPLVGSSDSSWHAETSGSYLRSDFRSPAVGASNPIVAVWDGWRSLGMLVRMRRVSPAGQLDSVQNVSSHGPAVPLLFGLGSTIHAAEGGTRDIRRDGLSVRATAIASGVPVLSAGPLQFSDDCAHVLGRKWTHVDDQPRAMYGLAPIVIDKRFWLHDLPDFVDGVATDTDGNPDTDEDESVLLELHNGYVRVVGTEAIVGRVYLDDPSAPPSSELSELCAFRRCGMFMSVGMRLPPPSPLSEQEHDRLWFWLSRSVVNPVMQEIPFAANNGRCYIAISTRIGPVERVVGFVHGKFEVNEADGEIIRISKGWKDADDLAIIPNHSNPAFNQPCSVLIAPENATSQAADDLVLPNALTEDERTLIFRHLLSLTYRTFPEPPEEPPADWVPTYDWHDFQSGALLAPGLVR